MLDRFETQVGVHFHNDSGCAVANSLAGVAVGATHVQGCVNGYGERAGNADLAAVVPDLSLKLRVSTIPADRLPLLTPVAHHIAELVNIAPNPQQPFVGASVFAHKAGLHTSAIARRSDAYEHISPDLVGNGTRFVVSEMAGRSTLVMKAEELGLELDSDAMTSVLDSLKRLEYEGYHFEVADGSLELLLRRLDRAGVRTFFELESYRVIADQGDELSTEATVKVRVGGERVVATAEGNGPVNALDGALRAAIGSQLPGPRGGPPGRLPGAGPRLGQGHRLGDPGPHRLDRRRPDLDHHRGVREHHRRLVAGPHRLRRLRSAPHGRDRCLNWTPVPVAWHVLPVTPVRPDRRPMHHPAIQEHPVTQPSFVPVVEADQVRRAYQLHVPEIWTTSRPSELRGTRQPAGAFLGTPGPDQGFALKLARRFEDRLVLVPG